MKSLKTRPVAKDVSETTASVYFEGLGRLKDTPVYQLPKLDIGAVVEGPAMILDDTQTIVVIPGARVVVTKNHLYITIAEVVGDGKKSDHAV